MSDVTTKNPVMPERSVCPLTINPIDHKLYLKSHYE